LGHSDCPVGHWRRSDLDWQSRRVSLTKLSLNALSGIGGVQTKRDEEVQTI